MRRVLSILCSLPLLWFCIVPESPATENSGAQACNAPSYFGICDPYVPGTIISTEDRKPLRVFSTWSMGPAEKAGICPGDQIVAINGVSAWDSTSDRMVKEIISDSPGTVVPTVKRGSQQLEFKVPRVRESTLIGLTGQKFMRAPSEASEELSMVPLGQTEEELAQLESFRDRVAREHGFKRVSGWDVPLPTSQDQVHRIQKLRSQNPPRWTGLATGRYAPGFIAVGLKEPSQVLIAVVVPASPANRAGLLPGDELLAIGGRPVAPLNSAELKNLIFTPDQRRQMSLRLKRNGSEINVKLETELFEEFEKRNFENPIRPEGKPSAETYLLGISALYADNPRAAMIEEVQYPSPALRAGLHPGDSIQAVNGKSIEQIGREALAKVLSPVDGSEIQLEISRLGRTLTFRVKPQTYKATLAEIGRKLSAGRTVLEGCPEPQQVPFAP